VQSILRITRLSGTDDESPRGHVNVNGSSSSIRRCNRARRAMARDHREAEEEVATMRSGIPEEDNSRRCSYRSRSRVRSICSPFFSPPLAPSSFCKDVLSTWSGFPWIPPVRVLSAAVAVPLCSDSPPPPRHGHASPLRRTCEEAINRIRSHWSLTCHESLTRYETTFITE